MLYLGIEKEQRLSLFLRNANRVYRFKDGRIGGSISSVRFLVERNRNNWPI